MLLVILVMQTIGVYFVRQLEATLTDNFKTSIEEKENLLSYYIKEQLTKDPKDDDISIRGRIK